MTCEEFSNQFDVHYNNITSNQAPGLNEYEKSVFLTKAQNEIVKNYFTANSKGNNIGQGFDDSAKRQADFSILMKTSKCAAVDWSMGSSTVTLKKYVCSSSGTSTTLTGTQIEFYQNNIPYTLPVGSYSVTANSETATITISDNTIVVNGWPYTTSGTLVASEETFTVANGRIDARSGIYVFPSDVFIVINETLQTNNNKYLQVIPLRFDEYTRLMSKPYKRPLKNQAWRLINSGEVDGSTSTKIVEIITNVWDDNNIASYNIRYVKFPNPIVLADLDGLSINGAETTTECQLDPIIHEDILQRAVELAKIAWTSTGNDNAQLVMTAGQRSE